METLLREALPRSLSGVMEVAAAGWTPQCDLTLNSANQKSNLDTNVRHESCRFAVGRSRVGGFPFHFRCLVAIAYGLIAGLVECVGIDSVRQCLYSTIPAARSICSTALSHLEEDAGKSIRKLERQPRHFYRIACLRRCVGLPLTAPQSH